MSNIEVQKLALQAHNLAGRIMQAELNLGLLPIQKAELEKQIIDTSAALAKVQAQIETLVNTTDVASI